LSIALPGASDRQSSWHGTISEPKIPINPFITITAIAIVNHPVTVMSHSHGILATIA